MMGFISIAPAAWPRRSSPGLIHMTPGVQLEKVESHEFDYQHDPDVFVTVYAPATYVPVWTKAMICRKLMAHCVTPAT